LVRVASVGGAAVWAAVVVDGLIGSASADGFAVGVGFAVGRFVLAGPAAGLVLPAAVAVGWLLIGAPIVAGSFADGVSGTAFGVARSTALVGRFEPS